MSYNAHRDSELSRRILASQQRAITAAKRHPKTVVTGQSAAILRGLSVLNFEHPVSLVYRGHINSPKSRSSHIRFSNRHLPPDQINVVNGVAVTCVTRMLLDIAYEDGVKACLVTLDSLRNMSPVYSKESLLQNAGRLGRPKGIKNLREAIRLSSEKAESPLETVSRFTVVNERISGIRSIEEQATFVVVHRDGSTSIARVDFLINGFHILESDGFSKYNGTYGESTRAAIMREYRRQRALQNAGFPVLRNTWGDTFPNRAGEVPLIRNVKLALENFPEPRTLPERKGYL